MEGSRALTLPLLTLWVNIWHGTHLLVGLISTSFLVHHGTATADLPVKTREDAALYA